ncbi:hypothetical protein BKA67DRAFT_586274 [Truncatella angustata]|uniref:Uncharacterized protein n=1 Tax=Truncatella angustata TaxID=152316 RepID=A0A9P8UC43_9PEZI|nr:uncharacterized protein BKA67DRAFT_586274 [Truncatella angustata]KAH6645710.1 hypothetical protein BKA67DRAFT_586274 [Truncatella angustata]
MKGWTDGSSPPRETLIWIRIEMVFSSMEELEAHLRQRIEELEARLGTLTSTIESRHQETTQENQKLLVKLDSWTGSIKTLLDQCFAPINDVHLP